MNQQKCETSEFRLPDIRASLLKFCNGLNATSVDFAIDGCLRNLEWIMVDDDLATDMAERMGRSDPAVRASQFLTEFSEELGLEPRKLFKRLLHLEHVTRSLMGTHCVFKLRLGAAEMGENLLVVHLDNDLNVVMLTANYQSLPPAKQTPPPAGGIAFGLDAGGAALLAQGMAKPLAYDEKDWQDLLRHQRTSLEEHFRPPQRVISATVASRLWWPDWTQQCYIPVLQVKAVVASELATGGSASGTEYVVHVGKVDGVVKVLDSQPRAVGAAQGQLKWGKVRAHPWPVEEEHDQGRTVVLRDLADTRLGLVGTYAHVIDLLNPHWVADQSDFASDTLFGLFDRVMAYYHVDLIQRYFRALGLFVLDEFPQLMPLKTILQALPETDSSQYQSNSQSIQIRRLVGEGKTSLFTDARDPMVVYHETVHAITDALARLGRSDPMGKGTPRHLKFVQASAMDEGFADYFACALAEQQGAKHPVVGTLELHFRDGDTDAPYLSWTPRRKLESRRRPNGHEADHRAQLQVARQLGSVFDTKQGYFDNASDDHIRLTIEKWGNYWARFLWQIRKQLGAAIADVLIAHSLFFLTRWSDFRLGVAALIMADRLLFGGNHRATIIELSGIDKRWRYSSDPEAIDDLDYSRWIHIQME